VRLEVILQNRAGAAGERRFGSLAVLARQLLGGDMLGKDPGAPQKRSLSAMPT